MYNGCGRVVKGAGHKAKRLVMQCINGVSSNPFEGRTTICQLKDLILILFGLIFRRILIYIFTELLKQKKRPVLDMKVYFSHEYSG